MAKPATHILMNYPTASNAHLFRASDGMLLAVRGGASVTFGENPAQTHQRLFLDETYAKGFMRYYADLDANGFDSPACVGPGETLARAASIDERCGESKVILANERAAVSLR